MKGLVVNIEIDLFLDFLKYGTNHFVSITSTPELVKHYEAVKEKG
jgi:hypothetical protein